MIVRSRVRATTLAALFAAVLAACGASPASPPAANNAPSAANAGATAAPAASSAPIVLGVSGPLTGQNAQYGAQWKKGFDLALEEINGAGGINGRKLEYRFEDSQSDPKQSVAVAQKFVDDPTIVAELGDFSSPASMAASAIYERAGLVQFGFTNSHPDFTKGGQYMWSTSISQADNAPILADYAIKNLGFKKLAVLHLNTDWGRTTKDLFEKAATDRGAQIVATEGYLAEEKDFRSTLVRVRDANPDALILISYYGDGALITQQVRSTGLTTPIVASGSVYSPKFLELAGQTAEGVFTNTNFFPTDPRPEVQTFVKKFSAKYNEQPDLFAAGAYDAITVIAAAIKVGGTDRKAIRDALGQLKDIPTVIFGKVAFDPQTRRVSTPENINLIVKDGKFAVWNGKP